MYLDFFGLSEPPFRLTPNTQYFFAGGNRGAILEALLYAIVHDDGIIKVSGEVGSGKTMLSRVLAEKLPDFIDVVYLAGPALTREEMLFAIAGGLHLEFPHNTRIAQLLRLLQEDLIARHDAGRRVVLLVDEAQAMPPETLEEIRLLSNLESAERKLLQIVLFAQPELNGQLAQRSMRQLRERITHNFYLTPLSQNDIAEYVDFRLRTAGYQGGGLFPPSSIALLSPPSHGLTRRINILADKALLAAYAANSHEITPPVVAAAIQDSEFAELPGTPARPGRKLLGALSALVALALVGGMLAFFAAKPPVPPEKPALPLAAPIAAAKAPETQSAADSAPSPLNEIAGRKLPDLRPLTRERLEASQAWLAQAGNNRWFIHFTATDLQRHEEIETFLQKFLPLLTKDDLHVYVSKTKNRDRIGAIYGDFATQAEAFAKIASLPPELRQLKPYPRQVKKLR